jgi:hypothetical protein
MTHPQVADGEDNLKIWGIAANILNKQFQQLIPHLQGWAMN